MGLAQSRFERIEIAGFGSTARKTQVSPLKAQRRRALGEEHLVSSGSAPDPDKNSGPGQFGILGRGGDMLSKKFKIEVHGRLPQIAVESRAKSASVSVMNTSPGRS